MFITVKELISTLERLDGNAIVILAKDEEGNAFKPLSAVNEMGYAPEDEFVYFRAITPELRAHGYTDEDVRKDAIPAVVLWP